jgi:hypothetical protein
MSTQACAVCLFGAADIQLECAHQFCKNCMDEWVLTQATCPLCRRALTCRYRWARPIAYCVIVLCVLLMTVLFFSEAYYRILLDIVVRLHHNQTFPSLLGFVCIMVAYFATFNVRIGVDFLTLAYSLLMGGLVGPFANFTGECGDEWWALRWQSALLHYSKFERGYNETFFFRCGTTVIQRDFYCSEVITRAYAITLTTVTLAALYVYIRYRRQYWYTAIVNHEQAATGASQLDGATTHGQQDAAL